jgi:hypothetical protein
MASILHLARRFAGSLWPAGPSSADARWAESHLLPGETELWHQMSRVDRRHAAGVARQVHLELDERATRPVLAAALLHDVGKLDSGLGTFGRVAATLCGAIAGHDMAHAWSERSGFTRRVGLYLRHDELGALRLQLAGSEPLTVSWAAEHHRPPESWTVPLPLADVLKAADGD